MGLVPLYSALIFTATVEEFLHFYNVVEEYQEDEDPRNVQIPKIYG